MDGKNAHARSAHPLSTGETLSDEHMSIQQLQHLVHLLDRSDVSELELKSVEDGTRLVLRKARMGGNNEPSVLPALQTPATTIVETKHTVVAPWVGTFHSWAKPRGGTLVAVGDYVKVSQLVATIESLNVINEVETSVAGRVVEILVQEGQPVEYGQGLMVVDSTEEA